MATVEIGEEKAQSKIDIKDREVILELELKKGRYDMITTFQPPKDSVGHPTWGANYVHVSYLD